MKTHTPGPWYVADNSRYFRPRDIMTKHGEGWHELIAVNVDTDANANLIAAAPDLLAAAQTLIANAEIVSDPRMGGLTDCYALLTIDDLEALRLAVERADKGGS